MRIPRTSSILRAGLLAASLSLGAACRATMPAQGTGGDARLDPAPPPPPASLAPLVGEYGPDTAIIIVFERDGVLWLHPAGSVEAALAEVAPGRFTPLRNDDGRSGVTFTQDASGRATAMAIGARTLTRRRVGPEGGNQLVITPVRPIVDVRREALAATPPAEAGPFRRADLVELTRLDSSIKLDIRYATSNNLFGTPFYTQARAFLQRPAAEAVVRASAELHRLGYGLLVHDGYRPWSVTKMFWDAAPPDKHGFVADPALGSKHNRGEAVDITLYDLRTGAPADMPSTYDETTDRAAARYVGGTSRQRWHRDLLRRVMESQGFTVLPAEWWHFDYADWKSYAIGNVPFERIP
ncbi:MAG: M15 family metallopeptidase [bacterium]